MKTVKVENRSTDPSADIKVWCEVCSIRIAPSEERTVIQGKTYHSRCYQKLNRKAPRAV
jgi:hypothetical protein